MTLTKAFLIFALAVSAITTATSTFANAPGGSYIQCDPSNPRSPVRGTPDGRRRRLALANSQATFDKEADSTQQLHWDMQCWPPAANRGWL